MAEKVKRISVNAFENCMADEKKNAVVIREWRGIEVAIKRRLSLIDMMTFVDGVVKSCFTGDENKYTPEVLDVAIRCNILELYANFRLPSNLEKRYELVSACDIFPLIMEVIDKQQYQAMYGAIEAKIEHIAQANVQAVFRQVNELYSALSNLEEKLGNAFGNLDVDKLMAMMEAIAKSGISEEGLVRAILEEKKAEQEAAED